MALSAASTTVVSRAILAQVFKDPKLLQAIETALKTVQDTPEAVNEAQATADQAILDAAAAQDTADDAIVNAATAQATANAIAAAPLLVTALSAALSNERVLTGSTGLTVDLSAPNVAALLLNVLAGLGDQPANQVLAGPASGAAAQSAFRALVVADLPTPPTFSAYRATNQTIGSGAFVKVQCATEEWDVGACYDNATNYRFTPTTAGKYLIEGMANLAVATASTPALIVAIYKNGAEFKRGNQFGYATAGGSSFAMGVSALVEANGTTDYFELFVFHNTGVNETLNGGQALSWFQGAWVAR